MMSNREDIGIPLAGTSETQGNLESRERVTPPVIEIYRRRRRCNTFTRRMMVLSAKPVR